MAGYINHLKSLSEERLKGEVDSKVAHSYHELIDSDDASSAIASTNASGFSCDEYEITNVELTEDECIVDLSWQASGDQDEDRPFSGDTISGTAQAIIDDNGRITYQDIEAEADLYE